MFPNYDEQMHDGGDGIKAPTNLNGNITTTMTKSDIWDEKFEHICI